MGVNASKSTSSPTPASENEKQAILEVTSSLDSLSLGSPASANGSLSLSNIDAWEEELAEDPKIKLARTILNHSDISSALINRSAKIADGRVFNLEVDFKTGPITNQQKTGRCWLFATTNLLRYNIMKKLNLDDFQLSQSYLFFWDKLNKANYYLELNIQHADLPLDDRLIKHLSDNLLDDAGQWDMVVELLETYGVVPQAIYPESIHSSMSIPVNTIIQSKLREDVLTLRNLRGSLQSRNISDSEVVATLRAKKEQLMKEVYTILTATFGVPPHVKKSFVWEYYDKDGKPGRWEGTPKQFYEQLVVGQYRPSDSFSLVHDPRNDFSKLYSIDKLGNVWGGRSVVYVNTEIDYLRNAAITLLKNNTPVFFGSNVFKESDLWMGIMDRSLHAYEEAFDIKLGLSKADQLRLGDSSLTHAMVISGVHLDQNGKPVRWKVENSWGEEAGDKGWFVMTDEWFTQYVYQVVVPKALAPKKLVEVYEKGEKVVLPPWDPMGSLA